MSGDLKKSNKNFVLSSIAIALWIRNYCSLELAENQHMVKAMLSYHNKTMSMCFTAEGSAHPNALIFHRGDLIWLILKQKALMFRRKISFKEHYKMVSANIDLQDNTSLFNMQRE